jgi:L-ribulose-5-phosphate 4-epimerase
MVLIDLEGNIVEGKLKPSSDTKTHQVLYREFSLNAPQKASLQTPDSGIKGITHTHSPYAVAWAQAKKPVPVFGTTHADHSVEEIPCTDFISEQALKNDYELETGKLIVEHFRKNKLNPAHVTMTLVAGHGPFTWGSSSAQSVYNGAVLEEICKMALLTLRIDPEAKPLPDYIIKKHWERKHGPDAYYGQ